MNLKAIAIAASTLIATGCAQMDKPDMQLCSKKMCNTMEEHTQASCAKKDQSCAKKEQACAKKP